MKRLILGLFFVLCACSWRTPNSTFYMMNSNGLEPISSRKISVAVARVKVPDLLDRSQIVIYEKNSGEVKIDEFNRWAESFPEVLQSTVTNDLLAYLPNAYIKRTYFDTNSMKYSINIEINRFEAYAGGTATLSAWWNIVNASGNMVRHGQESFEAPVKGTDAAAIVQAQNAAVHQLSKAIAEQLKNL